MVYILFILAVLLCTVILSVHNAADYDRAWEEEMLTQEELEQLANELWEKQ